MRDANYQRYADEHGVNVEDVRMMSEGEADMDEITAQIAGEDGAGTYPVTYQGVADLPDGEARIALVRVHLGTEALVAEARGAWYHVAAERVRSCSPPLSQARLDAAL